MIICTVPSDNLPQFRAFHGFKENPKKIAEEETSSEVIAERELPSKAVAPGGERRS